MPPPSLNHNFDLPGASPAFVTTRWSVVMRASDHGTAEAEQALEKLCRTYWYPIYTFVRRQGRTHHEAQDLTQEFFSRLLKSQALDSVHPDRGRFRSFLIASFRHFLSNEWKAARRQKRGGGQELLSLDEYDADGRYKQDPAEHLTPEKVFERRWAETLLKGVLERLQVEWDGEEANCCFEDLKTFLIGGDEASTFASVALRLNVTEASLKWGVHKLRQRYRAIFREEIAHTVAAPEEIDDEIRHLFLVMAD